MTPRQVCLARYLPSLRWFVAPNNAVYTLLVGYTRSLVAAFAFYRLDTRATFFRTLCNSLCFLSIMGLAAILSSSPLKAAGTIPVAGDIIFNEYAGDNDSNGNDFVELLVLKDGLDLRGLRISDNELVAGQLNNGEAVLVFGNDTYLENVPTGTLIAVWTAITGITVDTMTNPAANDWKMVLVPGTGVTVDVDGLGGIVNAGFSTSGEALYLYLSGADGTSAGTDNIYLDFLSYESDGADAPSGLTDINLAAVADNAYYISNTATGNDTVTNWTTYDGAPNSSTTPGEPNPGQDLSNLHTTADSAPTVTNTIPANNATNVAVNVNLELVFSEAVNTTGSWYTITCSTSGGHTAVASGGPITFTLNPDADFASNESCTVTVVAPQVTDQDANDPPDTMTADYNFTFTTVGQSACAAPTTPIHTIQGAGNTAAITTTVTVQGVVVGDYEGASPALRGFYLQDQNPDADLATSEGIFVFNANNDTVSLGQVVQVTGTATEFQEQTQLNAATIESCGATATVLPVDITLPVPAAVNGIPYLERYEGMLVHFPQTLYVTEHFQLGRFGQIVMSSGGRLPEPTNIVTPGALAQAQQAANDLNQIIVDDELQNQNPDPLVFGRGGNLLSAGNTLRGGDSATGMIGILSYTWGGNAASGNAYRLRPINALGGGIPNFQAPDPRPAGPPTVGGRLKIASFNVLNYFLSLDVGTTANCGPLGFKQECRGAETAEELSRQQQKLNQALLKLDADVIGMMELENTQDAQGQDVNPLADIVGRLNASLGSDIYGQIDTGVIGTDTIRVGFIYKKASVTPVGESLIDNHPIHDRPPVAQLFSENGSGERLTVIVNHFKSKGSCPSNPLDPNIDQGDGQSCWNSQRVQQAQTLIDFISGTVTPTTGDPDVLLIGDFNAYAMEDPIKTLERAGYTNLIAQFGGASAYSYVFDGQWGYLDHGLASPSLLAQVTGAGDYHINADEPSVLDYNTNFKSAGQVTSLYNTDEFRTSDHDPVVIGLSLQPLAQAQADTYTAEAGASLLITATQGLLANDSGGPLMIISSTVPAHGSLALNVDGSFVYTPTTGYVGPDSFIYTVTQVVSDTSQQSKSESIAIDRTQLLDSTSSATVTINTVDTIAPETILDSQPSGLSDSNNASFAFSGTDAGTGVTSYVCSLDGAPNTPCTSPVNYTGLANGNHTFAVKAIDAAGNLDVTPVIYNWTIQTMLPNSLFYLPLVNR